MEYKEYICGETDFFGEFINLSGDRKKQSILFASVLIEGWFVKPKVKGTAFDEYDVRNKILKAPFGPRRHEDCCCEYFPFPLESIDIRVLRAAVGLSPDGFWGIDFDNPPRQRDAFEAGVQYFKIPLVKFFRAFTEKLSEPGVSERLQLFLGGFKKDNAELLRESQKEKEGLIEIFKLGLL